MTPVLMQLAHVIKLCWTQTDYATYAKNKVIIRKQPTQFIKAAHILIVSVTSNCLFLLWKKRLIDFSKLLHSTMTRMKPNRINHP